MMVFLCGIAEVQRGQQSEYICLKKCYQKFNEKHEYDEQRGEDSDSITCYDTLLTKDEDERCESQDYDVSGINIRRQSNHQYGRLNENTQEFNRHQDKLDGEWHSGRPYDVTPVMRVSVDGGQNENKRRQHEGDAQSTCDVESTQKWN